MEESNKMLYVISRPNQKTKKPEYMIETDEKIINIAQNSGFENMGYFIRRFKKEKGVTPSEYRKNSKKSK